MTHVERHHDKQTGRYEPTGQVTTTVELHLTLRALEQLQPLGRVLADHDAFSVQQVAWRVDEDNPGWPEVRADAIHAAIRQGRDYAATLGGTLHRVEHIADAGLLGGDEPRRYRSAAAPAGLSSADDADTPDLDPVPQELIAAIDARFSATEVTLNDA